MENGQAVAMTKADMIGFGGATAALSVIIVMFSIFFG